MATFQRTKSTTWNRTGTFKSTGRGGYSYDVLSDWEKQNKSALDFINNYASRISNGEWLSSDDRAKYKAAIDTYTKTGTSLRNISKKMGQTYTDDEEKSWQDSLSSLGSHYADVDKFYGQFADDRAYGKWQNLQNLSSVTGAADYGSKSAYVGGGDDYTYNFINNQQGDGYKISPNKLDYSGFAVKDMNTESQARGYDLMTDEEIGIYNYYYNTQGKNKADEYLSLLEDDLVLRKAGNEYNAIKDRSGFGKILYGLGAGAEQGLAGFSNFDALIKGEEGFTPSSQYVSANVRNDLGKEGQNLTFAQVLYDLANSTGNMLPSMAIGAMTGGVGGAVTMGLSSAGNSYSQLLEEGYGVDRARAYGLLTGAAEGGLSYALGGISKLGGKVSGKFIKNAVDGIDNGIARFLASTALNMASEGLEEGIQTALEPVFKAITTGEELEAATWSDIAYSSLLGAVSAGVLEGVPSAVQTAFDMGHAKSAIGNNVQGLTAEAIELNPNSKVAQKSQERLAQGKAVSASDIYSMLTNNEREYARQDTNKIKAATEARLTELGETGDVSAIADAIARQTAGEDISFKDKSIIQGSRFAERVANELNRDNIQSGQYSSAWAEGIGTKRVNADVYNLRGATATPKAKGSTETKIDAPAGDVKAAIEQAAKDKVGKIEGFTEETANVMVKDYDGSVSPSEYVTTFEEAFKLGRDNAQVKELTRLSKDSGVIGRALLHAYDAGLQSRNVALEATNSENSVLQNGTESAIINTESESITNEGKTGTEGIRLRNGGKWFGGKNTEGQIRRMEGGAGQNPQWREGRSRPADREAARLLDEGRGREVTVAQLGILHGSKQQKVWVIENEADFTPSMKKAYADAKKQGLNVKFFVGDNLLIEEANGSISGVRGYVLGNTVLIRADHEGYTADQLARHEAGHNMIAKGQVNLKQVRSRLKEIVGEESYDAVSQAYAEAYGRTGLDADSVWEEIICDSLGDMNIFAQDEAQRELLDRFIPGAKKVVSELKTEAYIQTRGSPEGKASRDFGEYTEKQYNNFGWVRANDVVSEGYWDNFTRNYADAVNNKNYDRISFYGEYMIPIYDENLSEKDQVIDHIVFARGSIENPAVTRVIRIFEFDEAKLSKYRSNIYALERERIRQETSELLEVYVASDFRRNGYVEGGSRKIAGDNNKSEVKRSRSEIAANPVVKSEVNEDEGTVTVTYKNGDVATEPWGKASRELDSLGNELSPAIQKRFANSKVVDENGRLKVVYHGTPAGEFFTFDKSKGSVEGDFGSGFYFTDNEADVSANYEGGGPDFENKVWRRAEQIFDEDPDIQMDEAREQARAEMFKGSHKFEVYLNVENPAIVGETILFDPDSYAENYNEDDYDSYDDYIGDVEQLLVDDVDSIIWDIEKNVDLYSNTDQIRNVLYDAYYEGGIDVQKLKDKINELYLESNDGEMVANEVARQIIESLGYDGIIDSTVSSKFKNMGMEDGTTHYIVFKPNQIKSITNQNPTDNPDIRYSRELDLIDYINEKAKVERANMTKAQLVAEVRTELEAMNVGKGELMAVQKVAAEKAREALHRNVEGMHKTAERHGIKALKDKFIKMMDHPTDKQYIPANLISAMVDVCQLIDTDTNLYKKDGSINKAQQKRNEQMDRLLKLRDEYAALGKNPDPMYSGEFDQDILEYLDELRQDYTGKSLDEMTLVELKEFRHILRAIDETLQDARKLIGWGEADSVYDAGDRIIDDQRAITKKRKGKGENTATSVVIDNSLSPLRNVKRMADYKADSPLVKIFRDLEVGVRRKNKFAMDAYKSFDALTSGANAKKYEDAIYKPYGKEYVDKEGRKFRVSKMEMMQAIMSYNRELANDKLKHVSDGGFTFADLDLLNKGKLKEAIDPKNAHTVNLGAMIAMEFQSALAKDSWAQEYMKTAEQFFDGTAKDAINEANMTLKHRIIATGSKYIPYEVNKDFVVREITSENDIQQTISGYGMMKDLKDGATQPLIITGLNNILERHIDQVSNIHGLAVPVRNFNKIWNVKAQDGSTTVQEAIKRNFGDRGAKVMIQAVKDVQGSRIKSEGERVYSAIKGNVIGATFMGNGSVVTKQVGSLFTATAKMKWRDPVSMIGNLLYTMANYKKISAEVDKYTASAWMRRQGMSDAELHSLTTEAKKKGIVRLVSKLPTAINPTKWISGMDSMVALSLWTYAKADVAKQTGLSGEDLNKAAAEYYDDIIENTQSMSDALHRPEIQKSGGVISETLGTFKTDLYQGAGLMADALGEYRANPTKENANALAKAVTGNVMSAVWGSIMTTAFALLRYKVNRYRDDEDDEIDAESWLKVQGSDLAGDLVGYIVPLFGGEVYDIVSAVIKGEQIESFDNMVLEAINDFVNACVGVGNAVRQGDWANETAYKKLINSIGSIFCVPISNMTRLWEAIDLHAQDIANGEFMSFEAGLTSPNNTRLYRAYIEGDADKINKASRLYKDEAALKAGLRKGLRENDPRLREAAIAKLNGDNATYNRLRSEVIAEGKFDRTIVEDAFAAEYNSQKNKADEEGK